MKKIALALVVMGFSSIQAGHVYDVAQVLESCLGTSTMHMLEQFKALVYTESAKPLLVGACQAAGSTHPEGAAALCCVGTTYVCCWCACTYAEHHRSKQREVIKSD